MFFHTLKQWNIFHFNTIYVCVYHNQIVEHMFQNQMEVHCFLLKCNFQQQETLRCFPNSPVLSCLLQPDVSKMSPLSASKAIFARGANHMLEETALLQEIHVVIIFLIIFFGGSVVGFFCFCFKRFARQILMKYILLLCVVNTSPYHFPLLPSLILYWFHIQGIKCFTH